VNVTDDSMFEGARSGTPERAVEDGVALDEEGFEMLDVGAVAARSGPPVSPRDEAAKLVPAIEGLAARTELPISADTFSPEVARAALDAGAAMINDTSGLADLGIAEACAATGAALVVMHTRAAPKREHFADYGGDVVTDVVDFLADRCAAARGAGVAAEQIVLDPGPDFAKTPAETVDVLRAIARVAALGRPMLLAVSRKYFVGAITGRPPAERLAGTLAAVGWAADAGAAIVRVHDVAATSDLLRVRRVLAGEEDVPDFDDEDDTLKWIRASG
jgi:dihydropteroate synthase